MDIIARLVADRRWAGWLVVLALSIAPACGFLGYRLAPPVPEKWVTDEQLAPILEAEETFRFNAPLILVLNSDDFFTKPRVDALQKSVAALRELSVVKQLVWMGDVPEVTIRGQRVRYLLPEKIESDEDLTKAKDELLSHPLSAETLISEDGTTALFMINTDDKKHIPLIRDTAVSYLDPVGIQTRATGVLALYDVHDRSLEEDHLRILGISYFLVTILAILIFRRPAAIVVAGGGPVMGLLWTIGWLQLIGQSGNELAKIILPVMVIMIGFTDGMHLVVRIRQYHSAGQTVRDSVYQAVRLIGPACFLTSLTTAIGFGSLMLSHAPMVSGFGRVSAIGVTLTFCAVVLVTPLLANSWLGSRMHLEHGVTDPMRSIVERCTGVIDFSARYAKLLTVLGVLITVGTLYLSMQLVPDDRLSDRVPHTSDEWQAMRTCDEKLGGIRYLRLVVTWDEGKSRNDIWPVLKECQEMLAGEPLIGRSVSIRSCLNIFRGPNIEDRSILANQLPDAVREQFYRTDLRTAQIVARQQDRGIAVYNPVFDRITKRTKEISESHEGFKVEFISDIMIEGRVIREMIVELMKSLAMASIIIFTVLAIALRSLRLGLISIMPNIMPLACSGALRLMISDSLDIASACSFAICLGIAVDDTIHFLTHVQHERMAGKNSMEANWETFKTVGSALLMTTIVMIVGLGTVMTSQMPPHRNFAAMGCTTLIVALVADLVFLPAILTLFPGRVTASPSNAAETASSPESNSDSNSPENATQ